METQRHRLAVAAAALSLATCPPSSSYAAEEPPVDAPAPSSLHFDGEIDPTAYALEGYSLHLGVGYRRLRVDLGAFAIAIPEFVHGNDGFDASFDGFGAKAQYFVFEEQRGAFVGVDAGLSRMLVTRDGTDLAARQTQVSVGVNAGYRIALPAGFYATPWLGVSYGFGAHDVTLGGATFKSSRVTIFPAIHFGYSFR
jgi:hypothetical protein